MRRSFLGAMLAAAVALLAGCSASAPTFAGAPDKVRVAASFYPMYEFARAVGGDQIDLINMVPAGAEPHDWEPSPGHIKALNQADLFIYNGAGFEHWVGKTLKSLDNKGLAVIETAQGADLIPADADHADDEGTGYDPHIWLDPARAIRQVELIRDALAAVDPAHREVYAANAGRYVDGLKALDQEFAAGLSQCKQTEFYTSHTAFSYLAQRYHIVQHPIMGLSPEGEPTPRQLAAIIDEAKAHQVRHIFFETLVSDKVARLVASEIGAETRVLNPLEGLTDQEVKAGKDYLAVMRDNLANLQIALECGK